jgi:hypothetical protein
VKACRNPCRLLLVSVLLLTFPVARVFAADGSETSHLAFVTEYVRELVATENLRASVAKEYAESKQSEKFTSAIHASTAIQLELRSQIAMLNGMHNSDSQFNDLIPIIVKLYEDKIEIHQKMIGISTELLSGPKPDVDYGTLAAEMPRLRAQLEFIDQGLFEAVPLVFASLIDMKADSKGHASHLVITKAERATLIYDIVSGFRSKLNLKNHNFTVSSASVLKAYLLKGYKCSDEPWD